MTDSSRALSIIAYYLSEYDFAALQALGYKTQTAAFKNISVLFHRDNNYLKLRRDEFDALPDSSSHRHGWKNRPPAKDVTNLAAYLKQFSFNELTDLVQALIDAQSGTLISVQTTTNANSNDKPHSELELENLINFEDMSATIKIRTSPTAVRVYNPSIIRQLKKLYNGCCQLCGKAPFIEDLCDITEVHHIEYFAVSHNNNANNLIVLCPNHHRLIHKLNPQYESDGHRFVYPNGLVEDIKLNYHL